MTLPVLNTAYPDLLPTHDALFRAFMDNSPTVAWVKNARGQYVYVNSRYEQLWDVTLADLWGMTDTQWLPAEVARDVMANDQAVLASGVPHEVLEMVPTPDGEPHYWQVVKFPFRDPDGELLVGGVAIDITERKRAAAELRRASERTQTILESITDAFLTFDRDWRFTFINQEAERLMGRLREELIGKNVWEAYPEAVGTAWYSEYHRAVAENVAVAFEVHSAASEQWCDVRAYPSAEGLTVYFRDVTETRHTSEALREAKHFAESIADNSTSLLYVVDLETKTHIYHNRDVAAFLGYTPEQTQTLGESFLVEVVHPDDLLWMQAHGQEFARMTDEEVIEFETRLKHADGTYHWMWFRERVFRRKPDGTPVQIMGTGQDISERKHVADQLAISQKFVQQIADCSPAILYIYDVREQRTIYSNREVASALGYTPEQIKEMAAAMPAILMHPADIKRIVRNLARFAHMQAGEVVEAEYRMRHADGSWRWFSSRDTIFMRDEHGTPTQIIGSAQDVTERKWFEEQIEAQIVQVNEMNVELQWQRQELAAANAKLQALATTDGLTELKNHRAFQEFVDAEFQRAARYNIPLSVILLDVDKFKDYNDTFGHPAGDEVLKAVAQVLKQEARTSDMAARYGGEEFVIIQPNTNSAGALVTAERLRRSIEALVGLPRCVTASFGVATLTPSTGQAALLIKQADQALYQAKRQGRNLVCHFENVVEINALA